MKPSVSSSSTDRSQPIDALAAEAADDASDRGIDGSPVSLVDVPMPQMGTSIAEGTVIGWFKTVGDAVMIDEPICAISTDKVDSDYPSPVAGVLAEILVEVGETVDVGTVLARINTGGSEPGHELNREPNAAANLPVTRASTVPTAHGKSAAPGRPRRYSPVVLRVAAEHDVDLNLIQGTGRAGRVTKLDVLAHVERAGAAERPLHSESPYRPDTVTSSAPAPQLLRESPMASSTHGVSAEPLSRIRQSIGAAMRRSLETAATCHTVVECDMTLVEERRRALALTALPFVARAAIDALRASPSLNATLDGTTITRYDSVHLGIAVALGADGLIVPVIRDAQNLAVEGLAERIKKLAAKARSNTLVPEDVAGATFTITSPGAAGATLATPIINVPQVAILDVEAIVRRPVVVTAADGGESIAIRSMVNLILGWDHRAVDGIYAAEFLTSLRRRLED